MTFHLRLSKRKDAAGSLFVRVISGRRSVTLTLPYRLFPSEWDDRKKCVLLEEAATVRREYLREVDSLLVKDLRLLQEISSGISSVDKNTARWVVERFKARRFKGGLRTLAESLSEELRVEGRERTARAYQSTLSALLSFLKKEDIAPEEITYDLLKGFERDLTIRKRSLNTISFYMRNLRAMYNKGVKRGWIIERQKDLFKDVFTGVATSAKRALTPRQLKQLENLLEDPRELKEEEKEALSLFLFSFHARGISFVDLAYLKKEDIKNKKLCYRRKKTGIPVEVEISGVMKRHLSFFAKKTKGSPFLFPLIPSDSPSYYRSYTGALCRQNRLLKQIAGKCTSVEKLSTHVARHSWATIAKKKNIPIWTISEALGHRDVKTTYIYLDSFEMSVIHRAARKVSAAVLGTML